MIFSKTHHSRLKERFKRKYKETSALFNTKINFSQSVYDTATQSMFNNENWKTVDSDEISQLQKTWEQSVQRLTQLYSSMSNFKERIASSTIN